MKQILDPHFRVETLSRSADPQKLIWQALHQDYCEGYVFDVQTPDEGKAGDLVIRNLLGGNRGHFGPLEHPQIVLNCGWFPHSTMQQIRTHRVGISFDVQSMRYSGTRIVDAAIGAKDIEEVFYLRPLGEYSDRNGKHYEYTKDLRGEDVAWCLEGAKLYAKRISQGFSEEHARSLIPFDVRQHWVMSANVRSLMHLMDLRAKDDAQLECQQLCDLIFPHFEDWVPEIAAWYKKNRWGKARLAP